MLPDANTVRLVRRCGGPMLFSGPIQPPMLGAAVASARLHNDPSFEALQRELAALIGHAWSAVGRRQIPLAGSDRTPIFMVPCDSPAIVFSTVSRLPMNHPGIRFTITRHNTAADIDAFVDALADALAAANDEARARGDAEGRAA